MARATFNDDQMSRIVRTIVMVEGRTRDIYQDYGRVMDTLKFNYGEAVLNQATRNTVQRILEEE